VRGRLTRFLRPVAPGGRAAGWMICGACPTVRGVDLAEVTDELYGLTPEDFRAARDERAAAARASGDKALAKAIAALRRPVVSAWLVNLLAREATGQIGELVALGAELRDAQQTLDGDRLRELSTQRRTLVTALVDQAKRLAGRDGRAVSLQVEREVEATLQAALADPGAATAVSAGQLAGPLSYAGLGVGEVATPARRQGGRGPAVSATAATAAAKAPRLVRVAPAAPVTGDAAASREAREAAQREAREAAAAERREREAAAAQRDLADAAGAVAGAKAALGDAEQTAASARAALDAVRQRAEQLDRELAEAIAEQSRATRTLRDAQRGREAAARALDAAAKRLTRAQVTAAKLEDAAAGPG
jgi:hypothetical protein